MSLAATSNGVQSNAAFPSKFSNGSNMETANEQSVFLDDLRLEDFEDLDEDLNHSNGNKEQSNENDHVPLQQPMDAACKEQLSITEPMKSSGRWCTGHHVTFSVETAVLDLDMPEENIATLLSYLELHPDSLVKLMNPVKAMCTLKCYGGPKQMKILAMQFMPMTALFNHMRRNEMTLADNRSVTFDVVEVADEMGWDLDPVYRELRSIQWNTQFSLNNGDSLIGKSGVLVEFDDMSYHIISPGTSSIVLLLLWRFSLQESFLSDFAYSFSEWTFLKWSGA